MKNEVIIEEVFNCSSSFTCFFFDSTGGEGYY